MTVPTRSKAAPAAQSDAVAREARRLATLLEVSQALSGTLNLKSSMQRVLQILIRHHGVVRGMVTLLREGELHVEAIEGFDDRARTVSFKVGEGITGQVAQSGKPIVVPRVSKEPTFLSRASKRPELPKEELSFICVPILINRRGQRGLQAIRVDSIYSHEHPVTALSGAQQEDACS